MRTVKFRKSTWWYLETMVEVKIPVALRQQVGGAKSLEASAGALREVLTEITDVYPALRDQVFAEDGSLRKFVNVYVNDEDARYLEGLDSAVADEDVVSILPAVAGGRP